MARRGDRIRIDAATEGETPRPCEAPGCLDAGLFRAPRSRSALKDYLWFCLPHVREYNSSWDYYKGMAAHEIEAHLRNDLVGQRPTWPLGALGGNKKFEDGFLRDPLGLLRDTPLHRGRAERQKRQEERNAPPPELRAALDVLGLVWPVDMRLLRERYKELAKRFHPDANGGDRSAEDRLKDVNRAYSLLRQRLPLYAGAGAGAKAEPAPAG